MAGENILISSAGRRGALMACVRDSIARRGSGGRVFAIDSGSNAPAAFLADASWRVPRCMAPDFADAVLRLCSENRIGLIIPTIDTELPVYAAEAKRFAESGVTVSISEPETVRICSDKSATHDWLVAQGFPTVRQTDPDDALASPEEWPFPLIAKPCDGSASIGVRLIRTRIQLEAVARVERGYIIQEVAPGRRHTVNAYVNRAGKCICAAPHWRMEVRAGEVSKGLLVKDRRLMDLARGIAEALPGSYGALNIQCFMDDSGGIRVIEMNARFGGGYPLAHRAGARFTDWLLDEMQGRVPPQFDGWTDDLAMLRYDEAVFVSGSEIRAWAVGSALSSTSTTRFT